MTYNLSPDSREILQLLADAVEVYLDSRRRSPREHPPVTRVELAYDYGDMSAPPVIYIDFDTRPEAQPDGDADFRCIAQLQLPRWLALLKALQAGSARITLPDGSVRDNVVSDDIDQLLAEFLTDTLAAAHEKGTFDRVAAAPDRLHLTVTYGGNPVWHYTGHGS